jgi:hypothetical protein
MILGGMSPPIPANASDSSLLKTIQNRKSPLSCLISGLARQTNVRRLLSSVLSVFVGKIHKDLIVEEFAMIDHYDRGYLIAFHIQ